MKFEYTNEIELPKKPPEEEIHPYDERQRQLRYRCFTHAYLVLIVLVIANMFLCEGSESGLPWFDFATGSLLCILLSFDIGMIEIVFRDAYLPPRAKPTPVWDIISFLLFVGAAVVSFYGTYRYSVRYQVPLIEDGILSGQLIYPICVASSALFYLALIIKRQMDRVAAKKQRENEE